MRILQPKQLASLIGSVVVGLSIFFIVTQLLQHKETLIHWRPAAADFTVLVIAIVVYALANFLLAFAWIYLLGRNSEVIPENSILIGIYGKSQIAKYIPGNIMHIGGRHLLGKAAGISHKTLVFAALYEIAGLLSAALLISFIGLQWFPVDIAALKWLPVLSPALLFAYFIFPLLLSKFNSRLIIQQKWYQLSLPLLIYVGFFLFAGVAMLLLLFNDSKELNLNLIITALTAFAIAWSGGFVTPGSPSGIGIRESILILLLSPLLGADVAIILAFLFRFVTVLGDLLFMVLTGMLKT